MGTIFFLLTNAIRPAGGHAVILRHLAILRKHGFPAFAVFIDNGVQSYYRDQVPEAAIMSQITAFSETEATFVLPEADIAVWAKRLNRRLRASPKVKVIIFNQNHFYTFNFGEDPESWNLFRHSQHLCTSQSIETYLRAYIGIENVDRIRIGIDLALFRPRAKRLSIAYMSRKMPNEANFIRKTFSYYCPEYRSIEWIDIDNQTQAGVADILGRTSIFIALQRNEGFGLPALEAMACGCVVAGYTGHGGGEYATASNGFWVPDAQHIELVEALKKACVLVTRDVAATRTMRAAARQATLDFSLENEERHLVSAWKRLREGDRA